MVKTKIKKYKGWIRLVVDDVAINKKYECSQKEPIVLATITNFFDSGCWSVEDFRISKYKTPDSYFEGSDACTYEVKSEEAKAKLISRLHTYREKESQGKKYIVWNTFDKALLDGDNPYCKDKYGYEQNIIARFSYKAALGKLNEIQIYWNNFEGTNLMDGKISNPNRQISEMTIFVEEFAKEEKTKGDKMSLVQRLFEGSVDIIGDVHGEYEALVTLIKSLNYDEHGNHPENRKIVFVGDLCDRGPDSPAVIKLVKKLIENGNAQAVLGNHELNLLQNKPKDGAGWYFNDRFEKDIKYKPFNVAKKEEENLIYDFLASLPIALEREDLRIVHATWDNEKINTIRSQPAGTIAKYYTDWEKSIDHNITSSGLLDAYNQEQKKWEKEQADPDSTVPFLESTCAYNLAHQMTNPVRVLTSGVEQRASNPFYASGKWRFVERFAWWDSYQDDIPVVVGHFWRRFSNNVKDPENLFKDIEPQAWHGVKNNVFCVDYSVGGRFVERNKKSTLGEDTQLVALRWPENQLILEDGQVIQTTGFENPKAVKKMKI